MKDLIPFIIIGLTSGSVYGLAGVGLVLTYKTSGVFNFAHGAVAAIGSYVFYTGYVSHSWPWPVAAAVAVLIVGPLTGLFIQVLARYLQVTSLPVRVAASVGLLLVIDSVINLIYGTTELRAVPTFLGTHLIMVDGIGLEYSDIATFGFAVVATVALSIFFRCSRGGIAMRAVVDNPDLLGVAGTSPASTRRAAWVIGCVLASASGVLFAPILPSLEPEQVTLLIVSAFGAAAIGAFSNIALTMIGGLAIGVLASLCTTWFDSGLWTGLAPSLPFLVLFVVVMVFPKRYLGGRAYSIPHSRPIWTAPAKLQVGGGLLLLVFLAIVPTFAGYHLTSWTTALGTTIVFLSLGLLVRTSGQVSLCQVSFMAIGTVAFSRLTGDVGMPWLPALLVSGLIVMPIGLALAVPAIRLSGLYLALATFGFGILLQQMFYTQPYMFGTNPLGLNEPLPKLSWLTIDTDTGFYYAVLVLTVVVTGFVVMLTKSRLGRLLRALSDSPLALVTNGATVNVTRVLVFCLSAFLAAIGGALIAVAGHNASAVAYDPFSSLSYFVLIMIVVGNAPWYAVLAAFPFVLIPAYISGGDTVTAYLQLLFGLSALAMVFAKDSGGQTTRLQRAIDLVFRREKPAPDDQAHGAAPIPAQRISGLGLSIYGVEVRFGGSTALRSVSIEAPTGQITGLIGPNGAGKTTLFNVCSGLLRPRRGRVELNGKDVTRTGPPARARRGLGRTFQKMEILESLTLRENVAVGIEAAMAGARPWKHLLSRSSDNKAVARATQYALEVCDLAGLASAPAAALSTGQRRLVEIARCVAGDYRVLMLDEPVSGLDRVESQRLAATLRRLVAERGCGILLVEHDMSVALQICDRLYVLDFGNLIFTGTPAEVIASPEVRAAYLGDADVNLSPAGTDADNAVIPARAGDVSSIKPVESKQS